jgi:hypothetical protein
MRITIANATNVKLIRQAYLHQRQTIRNRIEVSIVGFGPILIERQATQESHRCIVVNARSSFTRIANRYCRPSIQRHSHYCHRYD